MICGLTDAGNAYVDQLMALLRAGKALPPAKRKRVKWGRHVGKPRSPCVGQQQSALAL